MDLMRFNEYIKFLDEHNKKCEDITLFMSSLIEKQDKIIEKNKKKLSKKDGNINPDNSSVIIPVPTMSTGDNDNLIYFDA